VLPEWEKAAHQLFDNLYESNNDIKNYEQNAFVEIKRKCCAWRISKIVSHHFDNVPWVELPPAKRAKKEQLPSLKYLYMKSLLGDCSDRCFFICRRFCPPFHREAIPKTLAQEMQSMWSALASHF